LAVLTAGLRKRGFCVWPAANGAEALHQFRRHHTAIDVALLNLGLPRLEGPKTLALLQQIQPNLHCWFLTNATDRFSEEDLLRRGACGVLRKPFHLPELVDDLSKQLSPLTKAFVYANPGGIHG